MWAEISLEPVFVTHLQLVTTYPVFPAITPATAPPLSKNFLKSPLASYAPQSDLGGRFPAANSHALRAVLFGFGKGDELSCESTEVGDEQHRRLLHWESDMIRKETFEGRYLHKGVVAVRQ